MEASRERRAGSAIRGSPVEYRGSSIEHSVAGGEAG
jgi:hypothetical protein